LMKSQTVGQMFVPGCGEADWILSSDFGSSSFALPVGLFCLRLWDCLRAECRCNTILIHFALN
jgi:hypothetical protein